MSFGVSELRGRAEETKTVQWERPPGQPVVDFPRGWESMLDTSSGCVYHRSLRTGKRQPSLPLDIPQPLPARFPTARPFAGCRKILEIIREHFDAFKVEFVGM